MAQRWRRCVWSGCLAAALASVGVPPVAVAQPRSASVPIYVEDSPAAQDLVDQAHALRAQDRLPEAVAAYQQVVEQYPRKLMVVREGLYADAQRWVRDKVAADAELLAAYRRLHEPLAERELALAGASPEALAGLMARYYPTRAALEAGLRLAAWEIERAAPAAAAAILDELAGHPDRAGQDTRWHLLQAAAGLFAADIARLDAHRAALRDADALDELAQLDAWSASLRPPTPTLVIDGKSVAPAVPIPNPLGPTLWETPIPSLLPSPVAPVQPFERMAVASEPTPGFHLLPVSAGDQVLVNDGLTVLALDRTSGRVIWAYSPADLDAMDEAGNAVARGRRIAGAAGGGGEARAVAVDGSSVFAVVGLPSLFAMPWQPQPRGASLVRLDRETGVALWRVEPGNLDATLANAYFHGTPMAESGRVYALVRRSQMSGFQDAFLISIDAATGKLLWRRHISSAVAGPRLTVQSLSDATLSGGLIFVSDNLGCVACVRGSDGSMLWLAKLQAAPSFDDAEEFRASSGQPSWLASAPILVDAGLIVPAMRSGAPTMLIDPATGRKLRDLRGPAWSDASYLAPGRRGVLSFGLSVTLLDGKTLEQRWTRPLTAPSKSRPAGRAAVTDNRIVVPMQDRLIVIDQTDGRILAEPPLAQTGNVLALPDQIILATPSTVRSHMTWDRAYARLREQIANAPDDTRPGMALATVALASERVEATLEGVDAALAALQRGPQPPPPNVAIMQQRVFAQLLGFVEPSRGVAPALRQALFDRIASSTAGPADEVAYHLSLGRFMEATDRPEIAVDHYQIILQDPVLAEQLHQWGSTARQAAVEARLRLTDLVKAKGPAIYAKYEAAAAARLAELQALPDPDALLEIPRQYPLATSASMAQLLAAEVLASKGDAPAAIIQLREAYRRGARPEQLARIAGLIVELYDQSAQPQRARRWLRMIAAEHPSLQPVRSGLPVDPQMWDTDLAARAVQDQRLPSLKPPLAQPFVITGRLLPPSRQPRAAWPTDRVLTHHAGAVELHQGPLLEKRWSLPMAGRGVELLSLTNEQGLVWLENPSALVAIDLRTGRPLWPEVAAQKLIDEVGDERQRRAVQPREQGQFLRMIDQGPVIVRGGRLQQVNRQPRAGFLQGVNDMVAVVADGAGRVVGIDRHTGQVLWRLFAPVEELHMMEVGEDAVLLAGVSGRNTDALTGSILALNPLTGEPKFPAIDEAEPMRWIGLGGDGMLIYVTEKQVVAHHLDDGKVAWRLAPSGGGGAGVPGKMMPVGEGWGPTAQAWADLLVVEELGSQVGQSLVMIDPMTGQPLGRVAGPLAGGDGDGRLGQRVDDQRWHVLKPDLAQALAPDGRVRWRDAVADLDKNFQSQLVGEQFVVLLSQPGGNPAVNNNEVIIDPDNGAVLRIRVGLGDPAGQPNAPNAKAGWTYHLYLLDRDHGSLLERRVLGPLKQPIDPERTVLLDNRLLYSTRSATLVIPGAE